MSSKFSGDCCWIKIHIEHSFVRMPHISKNTTLECMYSICSTAPALDLSGEVFIFGKDSEEYASGTLAGTNKCTVSFGQRTSLTHGSGFIGGYLRVFVNLTITLSGYQNDWTTGHQCSLHKPT